MMELLSCRGVTPGQSAGVVAEDARNLVPCISSRVQGHLKHLGSVVALLRDNDKEKQKLPFTFFDLELIFVSASKLKRI